IPNLLLASDYFGIRESTRHATVTRTVFDCGIQLFVNLMELEEMKHLVPYENEMKKYAEEGQHAQVLTILNMYHEIEEKIKLNADQTPLTENYEAL
ncbi:unnamed protein product, partial [Didymodactylos carnosus]